MSRLNRYLEKRKPKVDIDQAWSVNSSPEPSPGYPSAESVDPFTAALEAKSSSTAPLAASVVQPAPPSAVEPTPSESCEVQHNALQSQMRPNLCPDVLPQPNNKPRLDPEVMPATSPSHTTGSRVVILSNPEPPPCEPINTQSKQARQHVPLSRRFVEQCEPESTSSIPSAATEVPSRSPEILGRPAGIYIPGVERRPIQLPMPVGPRPSAQYIYVANMPTTISVGCPLDPYTQTLPISIGAPCYGPTISEPQYGQMHPYLVQGLNHHVGEIEYDPAYADPYYGFPSEGLSEWLAEASMGNVSANDDRPLCLDYLKGRCKQNRYKCKFAHPALEGAPVPVAQEPPSCDPSTQICEVWVLTGFCKFGSKCHFQHPPMTAPGAGVQCSPAVTKKMQEYAKRVARWRESTNDERPTIDAAPTSKTQA